MYTLDYKVLVLAVLALPFLMFIVLGLCGKYLRPMVSGVFGTISMGMAMLLSYITAYQYFFVGERSMAEGGYQAFTAFSLRCLRWLTFSDALYIDLGVYLDQISTLMLVVITTVSFLVHLYSIGYMRGERGMQRYYAFLSLFSFSMLGLVVATNIFQMYIFWELVGVSSFLLIGFYYTKPSAVAAAKKAFIVTRFADFFFLIGILVLSYFTETFDFVHLTDPNSEKFHSFAGSAFMGVSAVSWAMFLIFMGGVGKSALFPFHIWLPDAMEGPTPVSALIHAATMVVAGVFLVARMFPVYLFHTPEVLEIIGYIGAFTALFAAIVACSQTDIKRVLAFSTISQIAYMISALSVSGFQADAGLGYMASMFHLFTHAFFKALLFLGAGAIIHAVHSNEMGDMGGLKRYMPITRWTFLIACLAIAGIPPFSGFVSKDEILVAALKNNQIIFASLFLAAGLTAFYMFRLYYRIFHYQDKEYMHKPHDGEFVMSFPLIVLAIVTCLSGFLPFSHWITADGEPFDMHVNYLVAAMSVGIALLGIGLASLLYLNKNAKTHYLSKRFSRLHRVVTNKFYVDEIWLFVTKKVVFQCISRPMAWIDVHVIDGFMNSVATTTHAASDSIKGWQSGRIQQYALIYLVGVLVLFVIVGGWLYNFVMK